MVDGLIDPNAKDDVDPRRPLRRRRGRRRRRRGRRGRGGRRRRRRRRAAVRRAAARSCESEALEKFARIRRQFDKMRKALEQEGLPSSRPTCKAAGQHLQRAAGHPLHRASGREAVRHAARPGRRGAPHRESRSSTLRVNNAGMPRAALHQGVPGQRDQPGLGRRRSRTASIRTADAWAASCRRSRSCSRSSIDLQKRVGLPLRGPARRSTSRCRPARRRRAARRGR